MDRDALIELAERLRKNMIRGHLLDYVEGSLALLKKGPSSPEPKTVGQKILASAQEAVSIAKGELPVLHHFHECPTCKERRAKKAAAQKRYRAKLGVKA